MSDTAQLARTGTAGALVIGGTLYTGWYLLAIATAIVVTGALIIRLSFRPRLAAGQSTRTARTATEHDDAEPGVDA